jgi:hypothetical protein
MKKNNGYKNYVNYFKKWDGAGPFGIGLMVLGVWLIWMGWQYIPFSYPIAMVLIPLGLVLFFYGNIGRASEADIQNCIEKSEEKIHFNELEEIPALRKRTPKELTEQTYQGYTLKNGVLFKKMKNGSLCSSEYDIAKMVTLNDGFYVKMLHFSFISDEHEIVAYDVPFSLLESITVERKNVNLMKSQVPYPAKTCCLVLTYDGGKKVKLPAKDDIYLEEEIEKLKKIAGI